MAVKYTFSDGHSIVMTEEQSRKFDWAYKIWREHGAILGVKERWKEKK